MALHFARGQNTDGMKLWKFARRRDARHRLRELLAVHLHLQLAALPQRGERFEHLPLDDAAAFLDDKHLVAVPGKLDDDRLVQRVAHA